MNWRGKRNGLPAGEGERLMEVAAVAYRESVIREFEEAARDPGAPDLSPEAAAQLHSDVMNGFARFRKEQAGKRRLRRALQIAACLAVLCVVLPFGILQVDAARAATVNYLIQAFPQFSEIRYDVESNAQPPLGWKSPYYPTWLPERATVTHIQMGKQADFIWYRDHDGYEYEFVVMHGTKQVPLFDTENMASWPVEIKGHEAILSYDEERRIRALVIPIEDNILMVRGQISEQEIMQIGENINLL